MPLRKLPFIINLIMAWNRNFSKTLKYVDSKFFTILVMCWNNINLFLVAYRNFWTLDARDGRWTLDAGLWTLDAGRRTLYAERWTMDARLWMLDPGCRTLDVGCWTQHAGLWTLDAGLCTLDSGCWTLDAGLWMLDAGLCTLDSARWTLHAGLWMLDAGRWTLDSQPWTLSLIVAEQNQNPVSDFVWLNYWKFFGYESLRTMVTLVL